jgi:hypothetical protein
MIMTTLNDSYKATIDRILSKEGKTHVIAFYSFEQRDYLQQRAEELGWTFWNEDGNSFGAAVVKKEST